MEDKMSNIEQGKRRAVKSIDLKKRPRRLRTEIGLINAGDITYLTSDRAKDCPIPKAIKRTRGVYKKVHIVVAHLFEIHNYRLGTLCWPDCKRDCRAHNITIKKINKFLKKNN
jgi:hypothetical protein